MLHTATCQINRKPLQILLFVDEPFQHSQCMNILGVTETENPAI